MKYPTYLPTDFVKQDDKQRFKSYLDGFQPLGSDYEPTKAAPDLFTEAARIAREKGYDDDAGRVVQAILRTEGALSGEVGDKDLPGAGSFGPLQFYRKYGMLPSYAKSLGVSEDDAAEHARKNPTHAIDWALGGYLGNAIREGQAKGLRGAELATYAQQHGQRSQAPERAGQNYSAMFGGGAPIPAHAPTTIGPREAAIPAHTPADDRAEFGKYLSSFPELGSDLQMGKERAIPAHEPKDDKQAFGEFLDSFPKLGGDLLGGLGQAIGGLGRGQEEPEPGGGLNIKGGLPRGMSQTAEQQQQELDPYAQAGRQAIAKELEIANLPFEVAASATVGPLAGFATPEQSSQVGLLGLAKNLAQKGPVEGVQEAGRYWREDVGEALPGMKGLAEGLIPAGPSEVKAGIQAAKQIPRLGKEAAGLYFQKTAKVPIGLSVEDVSKGAKGVPEPPRAGESPIRPLAEQAAETSVEEGLQEAVGQMGPPKGMLYDAAGNLMGKPNKVELVLDSGTPVSKGLVEVLGPMGETLSLVGKPGVARTAAGAEAIDLMQLSKEVRNRLPNLTKLKDMPDVVANLVGMAQDSKVAAQIDRYRQGVITHKELIDDLAPRLGMTAENFLKHPVGRAYNETELLVLRAAVVQKTGELAALADDVARRGGIGALTEAEKVGAMRQLVEVAQLQAVARGGAATAGRTLNQQKIVIDRAMAQAVTGSNEKIAAEKLLKDTEVAAKAARAKAEKQMADAKARADARLVQEAEKEIARVEKEIARAQEAAKKRLERADALMGRTAQRQQEQASKILEALGGRKVTEDVLRNWLAVQQSGDALAAAKFIKGLQQPSLWDRITILRYGSMLSATSTHLTNSMSNVGQLALDVGLKPVQVGIDIPRAALTKTERTRYMGEWGPELRGILEGFLTGVKEAALVMKTGIDPGELSKLDRIRPGFQSGNAVGDFLAEGPLRSLVAADKMLRGASFGGKVRALAARQAIKEGTKGAARSRRIDEIVGNILDFPELLEEAQKGAARVVLQESRKETGWLAQVHDTPLGAPFQIAVPFVRTPYNIAAQGAGLTPLGFAATLKSASAGKTGEAVDRAARALFGTAVIGVSTVLAANGLMTAGYPTDATEKSTLPPGWQPWALRIPGANGEPARYVSYQNLGPFGIPLAIGSLYGQAQRNGRPITDPAVHAGVVMGVGRYMVDNTFARGVFDLLKGIEDPDRYGENLVENLVTQAVPFASLQRQITRALDMGQRDPQGAIEAILAINPLTAQQVGAKYTPLGDVARQQPTGIGAFVNPFRMTTERDEPTLQALREADVGITAPPKSLDRLPLTRTESQGIQSRAGADMRKIIAPLQNDPAFRALPQTARAYILERVQSEARKQAKDKSKVFGNAPPEDLANRVLNMLRKELEPMR